MHALLDGACLPPTQESQSTLHDASSQDCGRIPFPSLHLPTTRVIHDAVLPPRHDADLALLSSQLEVTQNSQLLYELKDTSVSEPDTTLAAILAPYQG